MTIKVYPEIPVLQKELIDDGHGYYPGKVSFEANGHALNVKNALVDVTNVGGSTAQVYVFPASAIQMAVVSSSANDAAAGTGIRTVDIEYLDTNYAMQSETVTLNGTTPVNTVATNILRINDMYAKTVGSGGASAGNISLTSVGGATTYAYIEASFNRSSHGVYTIPAGKTGYITHIIISEGTGTGTHYTRFNIAITAQDGVYVPGVFIGHDSAAAMNSMGTIYYDIPIYCPAKTDIKIQAVSDASGANAECNSHFSGWYE